MGMVSEFLPRMESEVHGFSLSSGLRWRGWNGFVADVWDVECRADAGGLYHSPDNRLFIILAISGGGSLELTDLGTGEKASHTAPLSMSYIPAGVRVSSRAVHLERLLHLDLHLPEWALQRQFGRRFSQEVLGRTRLQFRDDRVGALASLIAEECQSADPLDDAYGASLMGALLCALFDLRPVERKPRPTLSRKQLRQSMDYIDDHCFETIRLHDLASLIGLSESYFSHAFKASTGVPPLRWQMEARISKVKDLLANQSGSLTEIAAMAGFADQAHLTRAFKKLVGQTPSEWRRNGRDMS